MDHAIARAQTLSQRVLAGRKPVEIAREAA
jgi:hypothetical protein